MSDFLEGEKAGSATLQPLPQDINGKLSMALRYKEQGTDHFKAGNFKKAIASYAKVTAFTRGLPGSKRGLSGIGEMAGSGTSVLPIDATDEQRAVDLETVALTNIAMCYLKLGEPRNAIEFCQKALKSSPNAWKAVLRKSEAQTMMGNYEIAKVTLAEALRMAPDAAAKAAVMKEKEKLISAEKVATQLDNVRQKKAFAKLYEKDLTSAVASSSTEGSEQKPSSL